MPGRGIFLLAVAFALLPLPGLARAGCAPAARAIVAEVYYDAIGDDTGCEFVELFNPTPRTFPLAGLRLEAGDGSAPGRWTLRWTGSAGDSIPAHGRFVVGGSRVVPPPDAVVTLELQNGPDAMRLVWPDGAIEVVGYGALEFPEYFCGAPAADTPPGKSLARVPDDADLGSNALDFRIAAPSPGRANRAGRDAALIEGSLALTPEQPEAGASASLRGAATDCGATPLAAGEARIEVEEIAAGTTVPLTAQPLAPALAPGDTAGFEVALPPLAAGKRTLRVRVALAGDERPENDADSLRVRIGPGPLEATEIQFHPAAAEGEWVEVLNRSGAPLALTDFTLSDRGTARGVPGGGEGALEPESLAVFCQDRAALLARYAGLEARRVWQVVPWSALNNSDDSTAVADIVTLREADGTPCARVAYSAAGVPAGVPIEWRDGGWWPALDPAGTPLSPPRAPPALAGAFELSPRRAAPGTAVRLAWSLPWGKARVAAEVFDLAGRRVGWALPEALAPARGERVWTPAGLLPGLYLVALRARAESGGGSLTATRVLRLEGLAP